MMSDFEILTSHLGATLLLGTLYLTWILRGLSRRMGEVTRMKAYYKGFNVGNLFVLISILSYILICSAALSQQPMVCLAPPFILIAFYFPLTIGIVINLIITLIYWGWLIRER